MNRQKIQTAISESTGLSFRVAPDDQKPENKCLIISDDLPKNMGFKLTVETTWKRMKSVFFLETFSGQLLELISKKSIEDKNAFSKMCVDFSGQAEIILRINDENQDYSDINSWPEEFNNFEIEMVSKPILTDGDLIQSSNLDELIIEWSEKMVAIVLPLLPVEDSSENLSVLEELGELEGEKYQVTTNRYERKKSNRIACISYHGKVCKICGFDFRDRYGNLGEGYIHVHHLIPLSQLDGSYRIDPIRDLIPVCPNCHAMLHKKNPPLTPDELRSLLV